jgi:hypothetical protein
MHFRACSRLLCGHAVGVMQYCSTVFSLPIASVIARLIGEFWRAVADLFKGTVAPV